MDVSCIFLDPDLPDRLAGDAMKRFFLITALLVALLFMAKATEYVLEYYDLHWTWLEMKLKGGDA